MSRAIFPKHKKSQMPQQLGTVRKTESPKARKTLLARLLEEAEVLWLKPAASVRVRRKDDLSARIGQRYERIQQLVAADASAEAIAKEHLELRRLQHLEAAKMTAHAEHRSEVAAGEGHAALESAAVLLAQK